MTHRSALHEDNRMVPILAGHCRGQSQHIPRLRAPRDQFEAKRGQMMTLIDDEMTVTSDLVRHLRLADETLDQCNVDSTRGLTATATDRTDISSVHRQKLMEAIDPLLQQLLSMHQHQRVDSSVGDECRGDHGFAEGGGRRQNTTVVPRQCIKCASLVIPKGTQKATVEFRAGLPQILYVNLNAVRSQQFERLFEATAWQRHVIPMQRRAGDDS